MADTNTTYVFRSFIEENTCPNCEGCDLEFVYEGVNMGSRIRISYYCADCAYEWDEVYNFSHSELPEDDEENDE